MNFIRMFDLRTLEFKHRKIVHYILLVSIISIQVLLVLLLLNEFYYESKLEDYKKRIEKTEQVKTVSNSVKHDFVDVQKNLQNFINTKNTKYLDDYNKSIERIRQNLDSISSYIKLNKAYSNFSPKEEYNWSNSELKERIDSLINVQIQPSPELNYELFKLKKFNYEDVLNSIDVKSYIVVDSVQKKNLLSRIGDAISGDVEVQKEKLNVIVTMKYGKKVTTGNIEKQIENVFKKTNEYYQGEFSSFKDVLSSLKGNDLKFVTRNNQIISYLELLIADYEKTLEAINYKFKNEYQKQFKINKTIRYVVVIGLVLFMVLITIALLLLTKFAYEYESRLTESQEKIKQNLNFKNRIVGMISHEIRSPLNIITIYSNLIEKRIEDKELKESFKTIQLTTNSLSILAQQILDYSKNEQILPVLNKKSIDLKTEIEYLKNTMTSLIEQGSNTIVFTTNIKEAISVHTDAIKIHQLFYNLIGNANKFTSKGQIKVDINVIQHSTNPVVLKVKIEDNGIGMNEEDVKSIFKDYFQLEKKNTITNLGAGLGMKLCKEIVELFGGTIFVSSKINEGTKVEFELYL